MQSNNKMMIALRLLVLIQNHKQHSKCQDVPGEMNLNHVPALPRNCVSGNKFQCTHFPPIPWMSQALDVVPGPGRNGERDSLRAIVIVLCVLLLL